MTTLQERIGEVNEANGFHDEGRYYREAAREGRGLYAGANLRNYYAMKIGLMMSEAAEALEELRSGRAVDETYYAGEKPEGVPSEIADVVIRAYDFAYEAGFDLDGIIEEKLAFNATRGVRHGREF